MKQILYLLSVVFILAAACSKDEPNEYQTDSNGVVISLPYQWKKSLHENGAVSNGYIDFPIVYDNKIAIPTTNGENNRFLTMINIDNGETIWQWNDNYLPYSDQIIIFYYIQHNNLLTYQNGTKSYCINLQDGTTYWKFKRDKNYGLRIRPYFGDYYFTTSRVTRVDSFDESIAYLCDIQTGELSEFLRANLSGDYVGPITDNGWVGGIINIIQVPSNNNLLAVTYAEPLPEWRVNSFLGLYNTETQEWVYERKLMAPPTQNSSVYWPQIFNNRLYASVGKNLVCHDLSTGEQIWRKQFTQDFLFSGFIIAEDKIIGNNEDTYTYCLNPDNGNIIWKEESAGTSGRMSYLNGIVYFVGGSTGKLHAIEASTGKTVWKIDAHKIGEPDGSNFKTNAVYVFPAENNNPAKVIALTHLNAYCFEAYK